MPEETIQFTISIPVREEDATTIIDAFLDLKPYNGAYQTKVQDFAGNEIDNPITPSMYVEDCLAYYVMDITKNYLIGQAALSATQTATLEANQKLEDLRSWIESL